MSKFGVYNGKDKAFAAKFGRGGGVGGGRYNMNYGVPQNTLGGQIAQSMGASYAGQAGPAWPGGGGANRNPGAARQDRNYGVPQNTLGGRIAQGMGASYTNTGAQKAQFGFGNLGTPQTGI